MSTHSFDCIVIGAGIAGASASAFLSADRSVALVEAEEVAGYHATGRSAAIWILNYGPADVQALTGLSRAFFENPPEGFTETPIMARRPVVFLAPSEQMMQLDILLEEGSGLREISIAALREMVPVLRPGYAVRAAIEADAFDMDVASLHQGFLRQHRARGGVLALRSRAGRITRQSGMWHVETSSGDVLRAPVVVNAAGAWGDQVAALAGKSRIGLQPKRRTGVVIDPSPHLPADWPLLNDVDHSWYARPEARTRLMVSPADETDMDACDVQPDELDIAIAIDRMQQALDCAALRQIAASRLALMPPVTAFSGALDKAAMASKPRQRSGNWWPIWWLAVIRAGLARSLQLPIPAVSLETAVTRHMQTPKCLHLLIVSTPCPCMLP